jgi:glycine reductase
MLELGTFPVERLQFGPNTQWRDGTLEVNREEIEQIVRRDERIPWVSVDIANAGDNTRIINDYDIIEPRVKVDGDGQTYPALVGRTPRAVGRGRTYRLADCTVVVCVDASAAPADDPGSRARAVSPGLTRYKFTDKSGPGAVTHAATTSSLCITLEQPPDASSEYWHGVAQGALMRVADRLSRTVADLEPDNVEVFDTTPKPDLPGVVFIPHLASPELYRGPYTKVGTAIYGITRAAPPWVLDPTELLDGAIAQVRSHMYTNNATNLELMRRHGVDWNYLACLAYPTNWGMESEKESVSSRVARLARILGADGAIVTTDVRGQRMVETMLTIQACEREGIDVVFMSEEEDPEEGGAPPFLTWVQELETVVSTGTGGWDGPFPPVEKVIGAREPDGQWFEEQPAVHGRYGVSFLGDHYGYGTQSYADY